MFTQAASSPGRQGVLPLNVADLGRLIISQRWTGHKRAVCEQIREHAFPKSAKLSKMCENEAGRVYGSGVVISSVAGCEVGVTGPALSAIVHLRPLSPPRSSSPKSWSWRSGYCIVLLRRSLTFSAGQLRSPCPALTAVAVLHGCSVKWPMSTHAACSMQMTGVGEGVLR